MGYSFGREKHICDSCLRYAAKDEPGWALVEVFKTADRGKFGERVRLDFCPECRAKMYAVRACNPDKGVG